MKNGSSATTYEPYYNYELGEIGTYKNRIFETSGKQLFNNELPQSIYYHNCSTTNSNGQIVINSTGSDAFFGNVATTNGTAYSETFGQLIEVEEGLDYTFSTTNSLISKNFITYFNEQKVSIGYLFINSASRTITMPSGAKYIAFRIGYGDSTSGATYKVNVMLNEGSTALPYEPYGSDKWYIEKNIGKYTFTGNETYTTWNANRVVISNIPTDYKKVTNSEVALVKCTHYTAINRDSSNTINNSITFYSSSDTASGTIINDSEHNTNTLLKAFMTSTHPNIYYVLATTTYEEITNTNLLNELNELEKIMSYNGTTNINISGNLPMILDVTALKGE